MLLLFLINLTQYEQINNSIMLMLILKPTILISFYFYFYFLFQFIQYRLQYKLTIKNTKFLIINHQMNFIQGLLHPPKNHQDNKNKQLNLNLKERKDQEDYDRLLQLCSSYGLDQKETAQLIQQFKKGNHNSMNNSYLNQSYVSVDDSLIESRNKYHESLNQNNHNDHHKNQQYRFQDQQENQNDLYKRPNINGYQDRHLNQKNKSQKHQKQQINQNNTSYNQMTFNDRQEESQMSMQMQMYPHLKLNQEQSYQNQLIVQQSFNQNLRVKQKQSCGMQINNIKVTKTKDGIQNNFKGRQKQKQNKKSSRVKDKQFDKQQIKMLIQQKSKELRSIQQFQQYEEDQIKEKQNFMLQTIDQLSNQKKQYEIAYAQLKKQSEYLRKENQFLQQKLKESQEKVNIFIKMKESDTAIVLGLKDTITSLTNLLQEKQLFCQDLQNKLNQSFVQTFSKHQKVNMNIPSSSVAYFQRNSLDKEKEKALDRKSSNKKLQNQSDLSHKENERKQLSDLTNISLNANQQQTGKLIRQNSMKKLSTLKDKQPVKRTSSRIDIKKYKGMIEQLRSNYGH